MNDIERTIDKKIQQGTNSDRETMRRMQNLIAHDLPDKPIPFFKRIFGGRNRGTGEIKSLYPAKTLSKK